MQLFLETEFTVYKELRVTLKQKKYDLMDEWVRDNKD